MQRREARAGHFRGASAAGRGGAGRVARGGPGAAARGRGGLWRAPPPKRPPVGSPPHPSAPGVLQGLRRASASDLHSTGPCSVRLDLQRGPQRGSAERWLLCPLNRWKDGVPGELKEDQREPNKSMRAEAQDG